MKKLIVSTLAAIFIFGALALPARAGDLENLAGKWTTTRSNENGQVFTQILEVKKDKFIFRITDSDKKTILFAKGDVKLEKCGDLSSVTFLNIQGGASEDDLNSVDDDRHCVYYLDGDNFTIGLNFDKDREKGPRIEVYTRAAKGKSPEHDSK